MISINNLSLKKRYTKSSKDPTIVLKNISFNIHKRKTTVLFGEEGSGIYELFDLFKNNIYKKYIVEINGVDKTREWKRTILSHDITKNKFNKKNSFFNKSIFIDLKSIFENTYLKPKFILKQWFKKELLKEKIDKLCEMLKQFDLDENLINIYFFQMPNKVAKLMYLFIVILLKIDYVFIMNVNLNEDIHLINAIKELNEELAYIIFTNNFSTINLASIAYIFYAGEILEKGTSVELFFHPQHPYLWDLIIPFHDKNNDTTNEYYNAYLTKYAISTKGDPYASRNKYVTNLDFHESPPFYKLSSTHYAKTHLLNKNIKGSFEPPIEIKKRWDIFKNMRQNYEKK